MHKSEIVEYLCRREGLEVNPMYVAHVVTAYRVGQMKEWGLISGDGGNVTVKGYEMAMDAIELGYRLSPEECFLCVNELGKDEDTIYMIGKLILDLERVGEERFKEWIREATTEEE